MTIGRKYGKIDLDRVGFFDDAVSGPFDKYGRPARLRDDMATGGQIRPGPRIELFEKKFERLFTGEALSETWREESRKRLLERKKNIGPREFQTGGPAKKHSTPNDFYGCFSNPADSLDHAASIKPKKKESDALPNCKIKPNPLGGPGYANICLSPDPKHETDPYDRKKVTKEREARFLTTSVPQPYFPPNPYTATTFGPMYVAPALSRSPVIGTGHIYVPGPKKIGGCKAGCFDKYPPYESSPYDIKKERASPQARWLGGYPPEREKYTRSIIDYGTRISCNANNYPEYRERIYPLKY
nr:UPF0602 protein C4orf47 homolog [Neodiprion pinetum]